MSGLWSFRNSSSVAPCHNQTVRNVLPAANSDIVFGVQLDDTDTSADPMMLFGTLEDMDAAVRDVQEAWLARTIGTAAAGTVASPSAVLTPQIWTDTAKADLDALNSISPDAENVELARAILRAASASCGNHQGQKAGKRKRRKSKTPEPQKRHQTSCAFVERMERRAAQRREARVALEAKRMETTAATNTNTTTTTTTTTISEASVVVRRMQIRTSDDMKTLRWFFVCWVALVEAARDKRAAASGWQQTELRMLHN